MALQALRESFEGDLAARTVAQVRVHGDPGFQRQRDLLAEHAHDRRDALNAWVSGIHSVLSNLAFTIEVGPITDQDYLVVRWRARGTYTGGFPGASTSAVGRKVTFTGTDTLRIANGKIAEYWAHADSLLFVQQLGLSAIPGAT
jgi:predicted ester cyclase